MNINESVLIVGGYGVVGQQIAIHTRERHPNLPILLAGRSPKKGEQLASELKHASTLTIDLNDPRPLQQLLKKGKPRAVIAAVNDPEDYLLNDSLTAGIPFLDITRWTSKMKSAIATINNRKLTAPVILSSSWMSGVAAIVSANLASELSTIDSIDIDILYSLKDKAGPNSVKYMDRLAQPFAITRDGKATTASPLSTSKKVTFPGGYSSKTFLFDTPDQFTLPLTVKAASVNSRITFNCALSTYSLVALIRLGIWKLISGEKFTWLRRKILYNPGKGDSHEIIIEVNGKDSNGNRKQLNASIVDPKGQTHLTSIGAVIQLERILGLNGYPAPDNRLIFPETTPLLKTALKTLNDFNVEVCFS